MTKKIITILLLLTLISCSEKTGNKKTIKLYNENIEIGTNLSEITKEYGYYTDKWHDELENDIYAYSYSKNAYDFVSQLPIINHFGWVKSENYEVVLIFDEDGLLLGKKNFYNRAKSRNSLVCNPQINSCLRKVK
jgi:hypothetical protein